MEISSKEFLCELRSTKPKKIYLLDTSWHLHRSAHTFSRLSCKIGGLERPSGHVYGVLKSVMDCKKRDPQAVVVLCCDRFAIRKGQSSDYKANRDASAYNLHQDVPDICTIASLIPGVYYAFYDDQEADDVMYSLAQSIHLDNSWEKTVYVFCGDNDLLQAVRKDVFVIRKFSSNPREEIELLDEAYVLEKYGVSPARIPLVRAVIGDTSDNLKGLPRFPRDLISRVARDSKNVGDMLIWDKPVSPAQKEHLKRLRENEELVRLNFRMMKLSVLPCIVGKEEDLSTMHTVCEKWQTKSVITFVQRFS